jgi:hypothetical protein
LKPGIELYLSPLSESLLKVSLNPASEAGGLLGVVSSGWSSRIIAAEASGRTCRAWFVGEFPPDNSPDEMYRIDLTVWCSSLFGKAAWRNLSVDELLAPARMSRDKGLVLSDLPHRPGRSVPLKASGSTSIANERSHDEERQVLPTSQRSNNAANSCDLSSAQLNLIRDAVRRKLRRNDFG